MLLCSIFEVLGLNTEVGLCFFYCVVSLGDANNLDC